MLGGVSAPRLLGGPMLYTLYQPSMSISALTRDPPCVFVDDAHEQGDDVGIGRIQHNPDADDPPVPERGITALVMATGKRLPSGSMSA